MTKKLTKKQQEYQDRVEMAMNSLTFKEDVFGLFALVPSTSGSRDIYSVEIDEKWLYSQSCTCPAGRKGLDCCHQIAVDRYCDQYRPTFKQQCAGVTVSREVIDRLLLNGKEAPAVQEAPAVKVYYCVVEKSGIKFIPVQYTEYGKFTSLNEGFYSSEVAYNWLEEFISSSPAEQVAAQEEVKAESKMQAWNKAWEEQYSQDPRIEASRIEEVEQEDGTIKVDKVNEDGNCKEIAVYRPTNTADLQEDVIEDMAA